MRRLLTAGLALLLWIGLAAAQPITVPQGCNAPQVASGFDATGTITCRQLNFPLDLSFAGIFGLPTTSQTQAEVNYGNVVLILDTDPGYKTDYTVEITTPTDTTPFMIGVIQKIDTGSGQTVLTIAIFRSFGGGIYNQWNLKIIGGPTFSIPASGALAVDSTDSFALPAAGVTKSLTVDTGKAFTAGSQVYMQSIADFTTWLFGVVENYNTSTGAMTLFVTNSSGTGLTYQLWTVALTGNLAPFVPILGYSSTSLTYGSSAGQIAQGSVVTMTTQTGLLLNNSHIVVSNSTDSTQYFRGIGQYNSSTGAITIWITDSSGSGTITSWSLFAQDGPPVNADQIAVSKSSATLGAGDFTFTIQAGQNFPIQGPVTLTALADPTKQMLGVIKAYSGTSLIVTVPSTGVYGSGTFAAWNILNTGPPQTRIPLYGIDGLQMSQSGTSATVNINAGSVRDSTDAVDLALSANTTLDLSSIAKVVQVVQTGTISSSGVTVTGSGTSFTTVFGSGVLANTLTDWTDQSTKLGINVGTTFEPLISTSSATAGITSVASNTSLTTDTVALGAGAGTTFYRGGPIYTANTQTISYGIILAYKTSDGTVGAFAVSPTLSGNPDLPSGYTYYRVLGIVTIRYNGSSYTVSVAQILNALNLSGPLAGILPVAYGGTGKTMSGILNGQGIEYSSANGFFTPTQLMPRAVYSATITPTAVAGSVNSVNTSTEVITWSTTHGLTTGQSVRGIGTVPGGWTVAQMFYVNALSGTTFALYTTLANALADTSRVDLTTTTTGATMNVLVASSVFSTGFASVGGVAGKPGSPSMGFDYNLSNALASTVGVTNDVAFGLFSTAPAQINRQWTPALTRTYSSTTLVQTGTPGFHENSANVDNGTWAQQGTTAFTVQVWIWG